MHFQAISYNPSMKILLTTLHAKYAHASLALPYLAAACRGIEGAETVIREFTVNEPPDQVLRAIVSEGADAVAFSCYIWNLRETLELVSDLKKVSPRTFVILGGPEASYGAFKTMEQNRGVDCVVRGEGENTFAELTKLLAAQGCMDFNVHNLNNMSGVTFRENEDIIAAPEREPIALLGDIPSPFQLGFVDLKKPLVYFETSRGCPFSCAFCMSSMEKGVRSFPMERIRSDLTLLIERGVKCVKLVDRTFNFDPGRADAIWRYILINNRESVFHFEIAADLLTDENFQSLKKAPAGLFRFEIGVQSGGADTLERVGRKSDLEQLFANVQRLVEETGVVVHLDLVAGLPGEDYQGFLASLERLLSAKAQHIQVEPLKVLKGSPMRKIAADEGYAFSDTAPYKILATPWLTFQEIGRIETISRLLDLIHNSGRFRASLAVLEEAAPLSHIFHLMALFWEREAIPPTLSQNALFEAFWRFCAEGAAHPDFETLSDALCYDFCLMERPAGRPPSFMEGSGESGQSEKGKISGLIKGMEIAEGSKVRSFSRRFRRDYTRRPFREGETDLLFIYISAPGKGLRVETVTLPQK